MSNAIEQTEKKQSYWERNGKYQKQYDDMYSKLVPDSGSAETLNGELLRSASRLTWEFYNNGNCNACEVNSRFDSFTKECPECFGNGYTDEDGEETCTSCEGSGEEENEEEVDGECDIDSYYAKMLDLIEAEIPGSSKIVDAVRTEITSNSYSNHNQFNEKSDDIYNNLVNCVMEYIINNNDRELSNQYERG